ncbi:hypothetical protein BsIDN1_61940 [Bacillus safensis]|uniref:Uncharacterized protein n=1 Tax=Bacillus safensis TaxID=561879 RepID=A0A5S9MLR0_BACIA|nr:hypothetical protein BsIDN1_61940 [Bacillus safensis]
MGKDLSGGGGPSLKEVGKKYNESQIADIAQNGKGSMPSGMVDEKQAKEKSKKWLAEKKKNLCLIDKVFFCFLYVEKRLLDSMKTHYIKFYLKKKGYKKHVFRF